jgi:hypothetical protein
VVGPLFFLWQHYNGGMDMYLDIGKFSDEW